MFRGDNHYKTTSVERKRVKTLEREREREREREILVNHQPPQDTNPSSLADTSTIRQQPLE